MKKVLILGAYGNFGKRIALSLAKKEIPLILGGRDIKKLNLLIDAIKKINEDAICQAVVLDIDKNFSQILSATNPYIVINTCGPFQFKDYSIAKECIEKQVHYIDLADGRDFVAGIKSLDIIAKQKNVTVITGASTVPALSSAIIEEFSSHFSVMDSLIYGITPGQKTSRGLATTKAVLSYVGKPLKEVSKLGKSYGWQNTYRQLYPELGKRWMGNCEIPDLSLFPEYYKIKSIKFAAGLENSILHLGLWLLSWLIRLGVPLNLTKHAQLFLNASRYFDTFGTADGGMHMIITGKDAQGKTKQLKWFIVAKSGDGPQIPAIPAIILAEKLVRGTLETQGAIPCMGLISLDEYLNELKDYDIRTYSEINPVTN